MNHDGERILSMFPDAQCTQSQHFLLLLFFLSATHMHPIFVKKHSAKVARFQGLLSFETAIFRQQRDFFLEIVIFRQ